MNKQADQSAYRRLSEEDVELGQPLKWAVHAENGSLLLAKGSIVKNETQRRRLLTARVMIALSPQDAAKERSARALKAQEEEKNRVYRKKEVDVFAWVDAHYELIESSYALLADGPSPEAIGQIRRLAVAIQRGSEKSANGLLAAVLLGGKNRSYSHIKALHVALLSNEIAKVSDMKPDVRLSLIAAGLTHDIAMWQMQDEIQRREAPLTDEQWQQIRSHTQQGVELLRQSGVHDPIWLAAVEQHHERLNGKGYHQGISEGQISQHARIIAIADTFAAMVRTRGDRAKKMPKDAMREIFMSRGEDIDGTLVQLFIKKLGMFPPGCMLRLITGEVGIATGAGVSAASPDVEVVLDSANRPLSRSIYRDTTGKGFSVQEFVTEIEHPKLRELLATMWDPLPINV